MLIKIRIRLRLFFNRLRYDFRFRKKGRFFQIIVPERFKKYIKYIKYLKYIITILSLFSSFIVFNSVYISFLFGLILFAFGSLLEKFVFSYTVMYIPPLPTFQVQPDKWIGNAFGIIRSLDRSIEIPTVGNIFSDIEYARKIHNLILSWSYGSYDDANNNVSLSAIVDNDSYRFFIYPSINRQTVQKFLSKFEEQIKKIDQNGQPNLLFTMQILTREFDITDHSYFPTFRERYRQGIPYVFQFYYGNDIANHQKIEELKDFEFDFVKIMV